MRIIFLAALLTGLCAACSTAAPDRAASVSEPSLALPADTPVVPAQPPEFAPDSIFCPRDEIGVPLRVLFVAFRASTGHADRIRIIEAVDGVVVGGERWNHSGIPSDGPYYVRVDPERIDEFGYTLRAYPEVFDAGRILPVGAEDTPIPQCE